MNIYRLRQFKLAALKIIQKTDITEPQIQTKIHLHAQSIIQGEKLFNKVSFYIPTKLFIVLLLLFLL